MSSIYFIQEQSRSVDSLIIHVGECHEYKDLVCLVLNDRVGVLSLLHILLPLPLDTATVILSVGMFVLAVILYDAYRQYGT
jgi:hypothetical protein